MRDYYNSDQKKELNADDFVRYHNIINPYNSKVLEDKVRLDSSEIERLNNLRTEIKREYTQQSRNEVIRLINQTLILDSIYKDSDRFSELKQEKYRLKEYGKTHPKESDEILEKIVAINEEMYPWHQY